MPIRTFLIALMVFGASAVVAQNVPDWAAPSQESAESEDNFGPGPPPPPPPPPANVPIDGGLGLLALAGAGLAARKLRQRDDA